MTLTIEQLHAVELWAEIHGRNWKSALREAWMSGDYSGFERSNVLQCLRNTLGPSWLVRFRLSEVRA